jgi:hypothetical protein
LFDIARGATNTPTRSDATYFIDPSSHGQEASETGGGLHNDMAGVVEACLSKFLIMISDLIQVDLFELEIQPLEDISALQAFDLFATITEMSVELEWCIQQPRSTSSPPSVNVVHRLFYVIKAGTLKHNFLLSN